MWANTPSSSLYILNPSYEELPATVNIYDKGAKKKSRRFYGKYWQLAGSQLPVFTVKWQPVASIYRKIYGFFFLPCQHRFINITNFKVLLELSCFKDSSCNHIVHVLIILCFTERIRRLIWAFFVAACVEMILKQRVASHITLFLWQSIYGRIYSCKSILMHLQAIVIAYCPDYRLKYLPHCVLSSVTTK